MMKFQKVEKLRLQALKRLNFLQRQLLEVQPSVVTPRDLKNLDKARTTVDKITTEMVDLLEQIRQEELLS